MKLKDHIMLATGTLAVTSYLRLWVAVFALPEKINVFQHGSKSPKV